MLLTKDDFQIGQVVACKHSGNKAHHNKGMTLGRVIKLSKHYVTVAFHEGDTRGTQFVLEESIERDYLVEKLNYNGNYVVFPSEQSYLEYEEKVAKLQDIKTATSGYYKRSTLTIDQVRRIHVIINE